MQITLANPRGFCAGVDRAIEIVERALSLFGTPVYVRHEVVHNKYLVDTLRDKGVPAYLIDNVTEIQREWLQGKANIGLTAGASAPEVLVEEVIEQLKEWGVENVVEAPGIRESVVFSLHRELANRRTLAARSFQLFDLRTYS